MATLTSVLIVDDEPAVRDLMSRWVVSLGLRARTAADADEALASLRDEQYELAVIDVMMPGHDGLWLATQLQRDHPHTAVVIATAYSELLEDAGHRPIADLLIKPFQRERFALAVNRGRHWRQETLEEVAWHARLSIEVREHAENITAAVRALAGQGATEADALVAVAVARTPETMAHSDRVTRYALSVACAFGVDQDLAALEHAARFHDIGKAAMPDALLTKPSPLTPSELAIMRRHVNIGADILQATQTLTATAPIVLASHEWFNGGGYPRKLAGPAIPLASRIIAVVDTYDAMTQDRAYRRSTHTTHAIAELLRCCGTQFDPDVVRALQAVLGRH